jgi:SAM-dependent methyltransferase
MKREDSFARYLASKKSIDDRALNAHVLRALTDALAQMERPSILEVGAGIGTMVERLQAQEVLPVGSVYTAVDLQAQNIAAARERLLPVAGSLSIELEAIDFFDFAAREAGVRAWDVLAAHALLDLLDLETSLPQLFSLLRPDGLFYFTINFDGVSILQPVIDPQFDELVMALYHRHMDRRLVDNRRSGESRTGRKLFYHIPRAGGEIVAAGSSDWVVYPREGRYLDDEAYFLHFIVDTIAGALESEPQLDRPYFRAWIAQRHAQIRAGTLIYIAHQLDFFGRRVDCDERE